MHSPDDSVSIDVTIGRRYNGLVGPISRASPHQLSVILAALLLQSSVAHRDNLVSVTIKQAIVIISKQRVRDLDISEV